MAYPEVITLDNGPVFTSTRWMQFIKFLWFKTSRIIPQWPEAISQPKLFEKQINEEKTRRRQKLLKAAFEPGTIVFVRQRK